MTNTELADLLAQATYGLRDLHHGICHRCNAGEPCGYPTLISRTAVAARDLSRRADPAPPAPLDGPDTECPNCGATVASLCINAHGDEPHERHHHIPAGCPICGYPLTASEEP